MVLRRIAGDRRRAGQVAEGVQDFVQLCLAGVHRVIFVVQFHERKQLNVPCEFRIAAIAQNRVRVPSRKEPIGVMVIMGGERDLLQVVGAGHASRGFASLLHGR
ncbi:hypothetical protein C5Y93_12395 [Blastopirellula marina]|uniref:Uncharacterized protein n=1 Tax=Blastopirellula marina TaxID=124 RepID=A0A2S8GMQ8_9BACT|nr:hypothetical protein C5Y93_12395 [Blastopirellula marina]